MSFSQSLLRPPITDLTQPWFDDECPELWVTGGELCELLGLGMDHQRHVKELLHHAELYGARAWRSSLPGRGRWFFRLQLQDLDVIRKLRERRQQNGNRRILNPVELFLERNKERLTALRLR